jgi:hypothetical protein
MLREKANNTFERVHTAHLDTDWEYDSQDSDTYCSRHAPDDPKDPAEGAARDRLRDHTRARKALKQAEAALNVHAAQHARRSLRAALTTCGLELDTQAGSFIRFVDNIPSLAAIRSVSKETIVAFIDDHSHHPFNSDTFQGIMLEDLKVNLLALRQWVIDPSNANVRFHDVKFYYHELCEARSMIQSEPTIRNGRPSAGVN